MVRHVEPSSTWVCYSPQYVEYFNLLFRGHNCCFAEKKAGKVEEGTNGNSEVWPPTGRFWHTKNAGRDALTLYSRYKSVLDKMEDGVWSEVQVEVDNNKVQCVT